MELSPKEFRAMNHPFRFFLQRRFEYPLFRAMGLAVRAQRVLEIGCGSGYGARLILDQQPASYVGIDLMDEQIKLARARQLPGARFFTRDAADLGFAADGSIDVIIDFGILHHVPAWRRVLGECARVLKDGGEIYIEEPNGKVLGAWDKVFRWGHPGAEAAFGFDTFEAVLRDFGFAIRKIRRMTFLKYYRAVKGGAACA